jgi:hypothetical protein
LHYQGGLFGLELFDIPTTTTQKIYKDFMKHLAAIALAATIWTIGLNPALASCYGYVGSRQETIKLQDRKDGYINVWSTKSLKGKLAGKLKHGQVIKTLRYVDNGICGGSVYIRFQNSQGRTVYGWVFSDILLSST